MKPSFSLERSTVEAGGIVKGWLKLPKEMTSSDRILNGLSIYFTGEEETAVEHWNRNRKRERLDKKVTREEFRFLKLKIAMPKEAEMEETDELFKVPFSVQLPTHIPSSMEIRDGKNLAKVVYLVRAHFGICFGTSHPHKEVTVRAQPQPKLKVPYMIQQNNQQLKSFALCSRGEMSYGVKILNTQLIPGERARIQLFIINNSWIELKGIHIALYQTTRCMAEDYRNKCVRTLCEAKFKKSGGQKYLESKFVKMDAQERYQQMMKQMTKPHTPKTKTLDLPPIPDDTPDSYEGTGIRVSHDVRVTLRTKSLSNNFEIRFPVQIVRSTYSEKVDKVLDPEEAKEKRRQLGRRQLSRRGRTLSFGD